MNKFGAASVESNQRTLVHGGSTVHLYPPTILAQHLCTPFFPKSLLQRCILEDSEMRLSSGLALIASGVETEAA